MSKSCPKSAPKWRRLLTIWTLILHPFKVVFGYWTLLYNYIFLKKKYSDIAPNAQAPSRLGIFPNDLPAHVHIFSLSLVYKMWNNTHYRSDTYQLDLINNLKNLAIPGTGVPLSIFCSNRFLALFLILFINPLVCLINSFYLAFSKFKIEYNEVKSKSSTNTTQASSENISDQISDLIKKLSILDYMVNIIDWVEFFEFISNSFENSLIHPTDWFNFWQNNCRLASLHSYLTKSQDYKMENKWEFLVKGNLILYILFQYLLILIYYFR